jgi:glycine cleavage system transcriptional repressor
MEYLSIVTLGSNQQHALSALSELVAKYECNLMHSHATVFATDLATMSLVCGAANSIAKLEAALQDVGESHDMTILIKRTLTNPNISNIIPYHAHIVGLDDSILVHELINFFAEQQIAIIELTLKTTTPSTAEVAIFDLMLNLHIPIEINIHDLRKNFITACEDLNVDGKLNPGVKI